MAQRSYRAALLTGLAIGLLLLFGVGAKRTRPRPPVSPVAGAKAVRICHGASGIPIPQYTAAVGFGSLWIACRTQRFIERRNLVTGALQARIRAGIYPWIVTAGAGAVWSLERGGSLVRIDPTRNKLAASITLPEPSVYAWASANGVWLAMDDQAAIRHVDPATNAVGAAVAVGLNPSGLAEADGTNWLVCHGDQTLWRIDGVARATRIARLAGIAPERIASAAGSLWVTGRGTQLLRVDPRNGLAVATTNLGAGGIDLAATPTALWAASASPNDDRSGLPKVARLLKLNAQTSAVLADTHVSKRLYLTGIVGTTTNVWLVDTYDGLALRLSG
jgi:hypothetical protein